jgi:voltage-gated potassium channel
MSSFKSSVRRPAAALLAFLRRENLYRLMGVIAGLVLAGAVGLTWFEENRPFHDAIWWAIVTLTTVGFGDISPETLGGRLIGVVLMFFGIGVLGTFTATIASAFVQERQRKDRGMGDCDLEDHIILCGWNYRTREILKDLRADTRSATRPIALVADFETNPASDDDRLCFVRGSETEDDLKRAGIEKAKTVVLVGDRSQDYRARDAKAVLAVLTVKSLNKSVYTIVELAGEENERHCRQAGADEIVVSADLCSHVVSTAALDHGISKVVHELLSAQKGQDLITMPVPEGYGGRSFIDVFSDLKRNEGKIALAIQRHETAEITTNPDASFKVKAEDRLVVISNRARAGTEEIRPAGTRGSGNPS